MMLSVLAPLIAAICALVLLGLGARTSAALRSLKSEVGGPYRRYDFKSPEEATAFARTTGSLRRRAQIHTGGAIAMAAAAVVVLASFVRLGA